MKKLLLSILVFSFASVTFAEDTSDGCGLGWQVTEKKSLSATTTRGTTNSVVPNTFGMSSGTLGCESHSVVKNEMAPQHFAEANFENLVAEMAQGQGEYLDAFASVMGCQNYSAFGSDMQQNYAEIIKTNNANELLKEVRKIKANSQACSA